MVAAQTAEFPVRIITEADVARVLTWDALIPAMERALAALSAGTVIQPVRHMLEIEEAKRYLAVMPAVTSRRHGRKARLDLSRQRGLRLAHPQRRRSSSSTRSPACRPRSSKAG